MKKNNEFEVIADTTDVNLGCSESININGIDVLICHTESGFFAVENLCSHANVPLCGGLIEGNLITCPLHGAVFDLTDGTVQSPPAFEDLRTFKIKIEGTTLSISTDSFE